MIRDPFAIFAVLAVVVGIAVVLEARVRPFRSMGSALVAILLGMLLSNTGIIPGESSAYAAMSGPVVLAGISLILLGVDGRSVLRAGPVMLFAFALGAVGSALGASVSALVLGEAVGPESWKLAGQYAATYIGGGVNFAAVGQAVDTSADLFAAGIAADVIVTAIWLATCLIVPILLGGRRDETATEGVGEAARASSESPADANPKDDPELSLDRRLYGTRRAITLEDIALLSAITFGIMWGGQLLGDLFPRIPSILWLTTLALALAQIPSVRRLPGAALMGNYLVLLFLASNGARSVIATIIDVGPPIFYFASLTVAIHGIVIFGLGLLFRIDVRTLAVASQANVGGAGSAIALATAGGYTRQLLPGVAVGLLGNALGNYVGLAVAGLMRSILVG